MARPLLSASGWPACSSEPTASDPEPASHWQPLACVSWATIAGRDAKYAAEKIEAAISSVAARPAASVIQRRRELSGFSSASSCTILLPYRARNCPVPDR